MLKYLYIVRLIRHISIVRSRVHYRLSILIWFSRKVGQPARFNSVIVIKILCIIIRKNTRIVTVR